MSTPSPSPLPADAGPAGTERFNTLLPDLGSSAGWDRSDLPELLRLQRGADGALYSPHADLNPNGALFGGQLVAQTLMAASHEMDGPQAHSLQISFLSPGRPGEPMRYEVRPLMQGRSFRVLQVIGTQGERVVISATTSFQNPEPGPLHQVPMPSDLPAPESLPTLRDIIERHAHRIPEAARNRLGQSRIIELRPLDAEAHLFRRDPRARARYWIKIRQPLPDQPRLHQAALGYLSDYWFPLTPLTALVEAKVGTGLYMASLNHTLWLHQPVKADDWLLVDAVSPFAGSARGLSTGQVYQRDGTLVATITQECLFRGWVPTEDGGYTVPGMPAAPPVSR